MICDTEFRVEWDIPSKRMLYTRLSIIFFTTKQKLSPKASLNDNKETKFIW